MPIIKIHRIKEYADALRSYQIYIDGEMVGDINRGQSIELQTSNGTHRIALKIDWCGSNEIEFSVWNDETIEFDCGNNTKLILAFYYVLFARNEYIWLRKR